MALNNPAAGSRRFRFPFSGFLSDPRWKRRCRKALRVYCIVCAILVTALVPFVLWYGFRSPSWPTGSSEGLFMVSYNEYMLSEYPARGHRFWSMALALREYIAQTPMAESDLLNYLGKPDRFYVTNVVTVEGGRVPKTNSSDT